MSIGKTVWRQQILPTQKTDIFSLIEKQITNTIEST